ncbi:MAG: sodium:solute symporter [Flavobacteriales bacterium]|nr:sodium:solute symporter [Flavobacteriales bacterium]
MGANFNAYDYSVLAAYFLLIFGIFLFLYLKDRKRGLDSDSNAYFLGGRDLSWFIVGASLFASNIGSEHLVGLAGAGASGDFPVAQFELLASFMLLILAWVFVPIYLRTGIFTMPQFLEKRYNSWARSYLTWISIIGYVLTKIALTIMAGGIIFKALLDIDFWFGAIIVVIATGIYTLFGGLKAVVYTDMVQMFILLGSSIAITFIGLDKLGGWENLVSTAEPGYLNLWRSMDHPDFPWTGIIFGAPILGIWYWCTDQFIVQRVLAARNLDHARKGSIFAAYLKVLPLFLFVVPGVIAYQLSIGPNAIIQFPIEDGKPVYDAALPLLTMQLLPTGLRGLVVAGLLAALMSSLSSVFNSCSTLITLDVYQRRFPEATERRLVAVGRWSTAGLVILGIAWIPVLQLLEGGLFQKLQSLQSYISPPIASVFLLGVFWKRLNARGAKYALLTGAVLGALRLILELSKKNWSGLVQWFVEINFLLFALLLFLISSAVLVLVSYRTFPEEDRIGPISTTSKQSKSLSHIIHTVLVVILVFALWWYFS